MPVSWARLCERILFFAFFRTSIFLWLSATLHGAVLYNSYDLSTGQPLLQLSAINADGTGDGRIPVNLPEPIYPAVSPDGNRIAVTAADPKKAFTLSRDVFILNRASGQLAQLTSFPNVWTHADTNLQGAVNISGGGYTLPLYKAFAPDNKRLAISAEVVSDATLTVSNNLSSLSGYGLTGNATTAPTLSIYNLDGSAAPVLVAVASGQDIHAGDGVDWSPAGDLIAWPKDISVLFSGSFTAGPVTALFVMDPVSDALETGHGRQITFPKGEEGSLPNFAGTYIAWEMDYQPVFSPDGKRITYVHAEEAATSTALSALSYSTTASLRVVNVDGSQDHAVVQFNPGYYVTHVSWSADANQLVFDAGLQLLRPGGIPYLMADPASDALYVVNADGSGFQKFRSAPATWPVWSRAPVALQIPALETSFSAKNAQLTIRWQQTASTWTLEGSAPLGALAAWKTVDGQSGSGGTQSVTVKATQAQQFYRLRQL